MGKRAFLVLGPESSGNRFVTKCFIAAGCYGDAGHAQLMDMSFEYARSHDFIVIRRSMPYGNEYPNLHDLAARIRDEGFPDIRVLVLIRNQHCAVASSVHGCEPHAKTEAEAQTKIVTAMRRISEFLMESRLPFHYMPYESIVHEPAFFKRLLTEWGLDGSKIPTAENKNEKWIGFVPGTSKDVSQ